MGVYHVVYSRYSKIRKYHQRNYEKMKRKILDVDRTCIYHVPYIVPNTNSKHIFGNKKDKSTSK
jgi:hypothetical protein